MIPTIQPSGKTRTMERITRAMVANAGVGDKQTKYKGILGQ